MNAKKVDIKVVQSMMRPGLLSLRDPDGHTTSLKLALVNAGFKDGEAAVIVDKESFELVCAAAEQFHEICLALGQETAAKLRIDKEGGVERGSRNGEPVSQCSGECGEPEATAPARCCGFGDHCGDLA